MLLFDAHYCNFHEENERMGADNNVWGWNGETAHFHNIDLMSNNNQRN